MSRESLSLRAQHPSDPSVNSSDPLYKSIWVALSRETSLWTYVGDWFSVGLSLMLLSLMILFLGDVVLDAFVQAIFVCMGVVLDTSVLKRRTRRAGAVITFRGDGVVLGKLCSGCLNECSKFVDAVDRELRPAHLNEGELAGEADPEQSALWLQTASRRRR